MQVTINTNTPYNVAVAAGVIKNLGEEASRVVKKGAKILIVSDSNVFPLYGKTAEDSLLAAGFKVFTFVFDAGEQSKNLRTINSIYSRLAESGFTRTDSVIALGGGVTGDMAGFAAATFLRGISYIQVPTSLLSQVDSSIGGKTGIDLKYGKNLVGAFHQPIAVVTDPKVLETLPEHYKNDGMGEVIKYGCIDDPELFTMLEQGNADMNEVILRCIKSKKHFVEEDVNDTGSRMILNFGHTFGHAIEKLQNFDGYAHGEAVGIGMLIAARIGESIGITEKGTSAKIRKLLKKYGLPVKPLFSMGEMLPSIALDKKSDGEMINLILVEKIGKPVIHKLDKSELAVIADKI